MAQAIAQGRKVVVYQPRDPAALSRVVTIFLYVDVGASVLGAATDILQLTLLGAADPNGALALMVGLTGLLQVILFAVCGFLCLKWIYRTSLNAHALARDMTNSPAWSVGWFFVPFASLWKPFQAVRETWQVSVDPASWRSVPTPGLLRSWWGCWLVANILGNISLRLQMDATSVGGLAPSDLAELAQDLVSVPQDLLFIMIVRRLCAMQVAALSRQVFE